MAPYCVLAARLRVSGAAGAAGAGAAVAGGRKGAAAGLGPLPAGWAGGCSQHSGPSPAVPASACRSACPRRGPAPRFHGDGGEAAAAAARPPPGPRGRVRPAAGLAGSQGERKVNGAAAWPGRTPPPWPWALSNPGPGGAVSPRAWALTVKYKAFPRALLFSFFRLLFPTLISGHQHKVTPRCVSAKPIFQQRCFKNPTFSVNRGPWMKNMLWSVYKRDLGRLKKQPE